MSKENEVEKNKEDPFALNLINIKNDILHFKDEILKDLKIMQKKISEKFEKSNDLLNDKIQSYEQKINLYNDKIVEISNLVITDKGLKEKIDKLSQSKLDLKDHILTNEIRLSNLEKEFQERVDKIEYILSDTVIYSSVIGPKGKFKTFHELIDHILFQLNQNISYREKNALDVTSYKKKLDTITQSLKIQLDNIIRSTNEYTTKSCNECEERIKSILPIYDDKIKDLRVENLNYIKNLEQFYKELKEDFKRLVNMKNNLYNRFSSEVFNIKKDNIQVVRLFGNYKKEFNLMKDRLTKLGDFIKDIRFRINVGQEIKRMEFFNMANKIDFTKKQTVEDNNSPSAIRKYINGEINADQLASFNSRRLTKANIGQFGNFSNLNNKMNLDNNDLNNEDAMNDINNYLIKNKNYLDLDINSYNNYNKTNSRNKTEFKNEPLKRKSVNYIMNNFSFKNLNFDKNQNTFNKNYNSEEIKDLNLNSINNVKRIASSGEIKGRKRYQSVFSNENINIKIQNNSNNNLMNLDLEDSKNSFEDINNKNNKNINYDGNIIKEEEESNSKVTESESIISEEQKPINNIKEESISKTIDNISSIKSKQLFLKENEFKNNRISHNSNININTLQDLTKLKEQKETDNKNKQLNDKKTNNIKIDCKNNKNQKSDENENKVTIIIERENDNIYNNKKKEDNNKMKNVINLKNIIIDDKNNTNANKTNGFINKKEKMKFSQTEFNYLVPKKISKTLDNLDYKSFKGKKYNFLNKDMVMKIKQNLVPSESQTTFNNRNKLNLIKIKNNKFINNYNNGNGIEFSKDEIGQKHYKNISMDNKKADARIIQKMVNNLQSYIPKNMDEFDYNINDMYKNKQNFIYKEMNNSYHGPKSNGNNSTRNIHKNKENVIQLKLK